MSHTWLPNVLAEIADVAGLDAALGLAKARGGTEIYIPAEAGDDHWIVATVGREAADVICQHFRSGHGGCLVELPLGPTGTIAKIRHRVDRMIADGRSNAEIARTCGYTVRGVAKRKAMARARGDVPQGRLL